MDVSKYAAGLYETAASEKMVLPLKAGAAPEAGAAPKPLEEPPPKLKPPEELPKAGVLAPNGAEPPKPPPAQVIYTT